MLVHIASVKRRKPLIISDTFNGTNAEYQASGYGVVTSGTMVGSTYAFRAAGSSPDKNDGSFFTRIVPELKYDGGGADSDVYMALNGREVDQVYEVKGSSPDQADGALFTRIVPVKTFGGGGARSDEYMAFDGRDVNHVYQGIGSSPDQADGSFFTRIVPSVTFSGAGAASK